jgi:pyruvate formate-lyase activating enzyme-like uncharacterized protein
MKFTFVYSLYVTVDAPDEDAAEEAVEAKLDEIALLPLDHSDCFRSALEHVDTLTEDT